MPKVWRAIQCCETLGQPRGVSPTQITPACDVNHIGRCLFRSLFLDGKTKFLKGPDCVPFVTKLHYHIRWSASSLDWKPFPTKAEATELAEHIKKRGESYVIVERDDNCERCKAFLGEAAPDNRDNRPR